MESEAVEDQPAMNRGGVPKDRATPPRCPAERPAGSYMRQVRVRLMAETHPVAKAGVPKSEGIGKCRPHCQPFHGKSPTIRGHGFDESPERFHIAPGEKAFV